MADYWKSTPKYWCKNCTTYVADTKLARANHEATGKHQSAVRRALRNLHRDHEREEREQDKAKREVARLNALVGSEDAGGAGSASTSTPGFTQPRPQPRLPRLPPPTPQTAAEAAAAPRDRLEQLAELGVSIPHEFRPDLAMAGDWTVTETRVVEDEGDTKGASGGGAARRSVGVRKRPRGGEDDGDDDGDSRGSHPNEPGGHSEFDKLDIDAAVQGLFKRPRQWGRDSRTTSGGGGSGSGGLDGGAGDLENLLSGALAKSVKKEEAKEVKETKKVDVKKEDGTTRIKQEEPGGATQSGSGGLDAPRLGDEDDERKPTAADEEQESAAAEPSVLFKKRKTKTVRHR